MPRNGGKNITHNQEKNQTIETDPEMIELVEKDVKTDIIIISKGLKENNIVRSGKYIKKANEISRG